MKNLLFLFVFLLMACLLKSQTKISGMVSYKGKGISGVNITLKDTYDGATSKEDGSFSFETSETGDKIVVFQHPKYIDAEKNVHLQNSETNLNVEMKEQVNEIDAVVISAGFIEASDKKISGSICCLQAEIGFGSNRKPNIL